MKIFSDMLFTISTLPQIVSVSKTQETNNNNKNFGNIATFVENQNETINKIMISKGFYQKRFDTLTLAEKETLFISALRNSATTLEQKKIIEEKIKDENFIHNNLEQFIQLTVKNVIKAKHEEKQSTQVAKKEYKESKKRIQTDPGYFINDDSLVSSKKIYAEIKQLESTLKEYQKTIEPLLKKTEILNKIQLVLNGLQIGLAASIAAALIASFFFPPIASTIAPLALISTAIGAFQAAIGIFKHFFTEISNNTKSILRFMANSICELANLGIEDWLKKTYIESGQFFNKNLQKSAALIGAIWNGITNVVSIFNIKREIDYMNKLRNSIFESVKGLKGRMINFKKLVTFVVIHETPQDGDYNNGGQGGRNIYFKNLEDNKIYHIDDMLAMDSQYLRLNNMIKVFDKNKGWYIRTLPNNLKEDNLG